MEKIFFLFESECLHFGKKKITTCWQVGGECFLLGMWPYAYVKEKGRRGYFLKAWIFKDPLSANCCYYVSPLQSNLPLLWSKLNIQFQYSESKIKKLLQIL